MNKFKRLLTVAMCGLLAFTTVGCGPANTDPNNPDPGPGPDGYTGNETIVQIQGYEAGVNLDWIRDFALEYEKLHVNDSYEEGKKGLRFKVEPVGKTDTSSMNNLDVHLFIHNDVAATGKSLGQEGKLIDINDVVTGDASAAVAPEGVTYNWTWQEEENGVMVTKTIEDLFVGSYSDTLKANDGHYYALPSYGIRTGLTYDGNVFNQFGFYLAHPDTWNTEAATYFESENGFGGRWFVAVTEDGIHPDAKFHWGRDGVHGDTNPECAYDDGLPTSMEELFILCEYMKQSNVSPLSNYGAEDAKKGEMITSLWAALSTASAYKSRFDFDGTVEVVTGWDKTTAAFVGADKNDIPMPITESRQVTLSNGYLANWNVNRYYGQAMLRIAEEAGWYSGISRDKQCGHLEGERRFIMNMTEGERCGILIEGDYWYNECKKAGYVDEYNRTIAAKAGLPLNVLWMPLPGIPRGTVEENSNGIPNPFVEDNRPGAVVCLNSRFANADPIFVSMLKDFMFYCYNGRACSYYTGQQGVFRAGMNYKVLPEDEAKLSGFQKSSYEMRKKATYVSPTVTPNFDSMINQYFISIDAKYEMGYNVAYAYSKNGTIWELFNAAKTHAQTSWKVA